MEEFIQGVVFRGSFCINFFLQNPFYFVIEWITFTPAQVLMQGECLNRPTKIRGRIDGAEITV